MYDYYKKSVFLLLKYNQNDVFIINIYIRKYCPLSHILNTINCVIKNLIEIGVSTDIRAWVNNNNTVAYIFKYEQRPRYLLIRCGKPVCSHMIQIYNNVYIICVILFAV